MSGNTQNIMHIGVCDDCRQDSQALLKHLKTCMHEYGLGVKINIFSSGEELLESMKRQKYAIVFLDVRMGGITGVETARKIREFSSCIIVFVTASKEYALDAIELNATHYLVKPVTYDRVCECFRRCRNYLQKYSRKIEIISKRDSVWLREVDINYIEVYNTRCVVHTYAEEFDTYTPLNTLYEQLDKKQFIQPHRSYVVNLSYINEIPGATIVLKNGLEISVSRNERNNVKQRYIDYLLNTARAAGGGGL